MKKLFKKVIATLASAAIAITSVAVLSPKNVQAAQERVISDENATAYINEDGSGYIELHKTFTENDKLTSIGGVELKNIITFNDGGYIDYFYTQYVGNCKDSEGDSPIYANDVLVRGRGPEGLTSGSGHLHFTDESGDTYNLSLWLHASLVHMVSYNSEQPTIVKISWNS